VAAVRPGGGEGGPHRRAAPLLLGVAAVVVAAIAALVGPVTSPMVTMFFAWFAGSVAYLRLRAAVAVMAWVGLVYAALLALQDGHFLPVPRWSTTVGIMVVTAIFLNRLVKRAWALAGDEHDARTKAEGVRAELEVVNEQKRRFMARMSHELRTPLNAIIGFSEVLARCSFGELNPKQARYVNDVVDSGRRVLALVDDVLDPVTRSAFAELPPATGGSAEAVPPQAGERPAPVTLGEPDSPERRAETARLVVILAVGLTGVAAIQALFFHVHFVPQLAGYQEKFFALAVAGGFTIALAAATRPQWLGSPSFFPYLAALAIINLSAGAYAAGPRMGDFIGLFYVGVGVAFIPILTPRQAKATLVLLGAGYGAVLAWTDGYPAPLARWAAVMGFVVATGVVLRRFVSHIEALTRAERKARAETERVVAELEVASRHKSEFLTSMSHEMRTPLNVVNGFSEVLASQAFGPLNDKQAEYAADVLASGRHLLDLVNDILDLAKADAGGVELEVRDVDLELALEAALLPFQGTAILRDIDLSLETGPGLAKITADEGKLMRAIGHLVSNALKFTADGGRVTVRAARDADGVEISVTDTGRGIDPSDHNRIFDAFAHAEQAPANEQGSGLGLAIARRYAELHGGSLTVRSDVGLGSVFTLRLPVQRQAIEPRAPAEVV
jgi:signal transduction histidine kinase